MSAPRQPSTCPDCGHQQDEVQGAISTICRECGHSYQIKRESTRRRYAKATPGHERTLTCRHCGHRNRIPGDALSTLCEHCGGYLDLGTHRISGASIEKLDTYGDVHFLPGCHYQGTHVRAASITVDGQALVERMEANTILVRPGGHLQGQVTTEELVVLRKGRVNGTIRAARLRVEGQVSGPEIEVRESLEVLPTGEVVVTHVSALQLDVQSGGRFEAEFRILDLPPSQSDSPEDSSA